MTLRDYLARNGIGVAPFARTVGVSVQALYRYIHLERMPRRAECCRIAAATGGQVTANDFYHADMPTKISPHERAGEAA